MSCFSVVAAAQLSCATPSERFDADAARAGFSREIVEGRGFRHATYTRGLRQESRQVRVYLGGDASPRQSSRFFPPDPTPINAGALRLITQDPGPALYLGRPCAHGIESCDPRLWSLGRYSEPVVASLVEALRRALPPGSELTLVGYSGGGTLAMLIAPRLESVRAVVTVAGNLDVAAWVAHHGHTPLQGLDPASRQPLPAHIRQLHLQGAQDRNIPPTLVQPEIARQPNAQTRVYANFDHHCCWPKAWPTLLTNLEAWLPPP